MVMGLDFKSLWVYYLGYLEGGGTDSRRMTGIFCNPPALIWPKSKKGGQARLPGTNHQTVEEIKDFGGSAMAVRTAPL